MRNYVETCKGIFGYNLVYNFFIYLAIKNVHFLWCIFLTHFSMGKKHFQSMILKIV